MGQSRTGSWVFNIMDDELMRTSINYGNRIYLSGITAQENLGGIGDQTRKALDILDARLAEAGTDRKSLLTVHIWLRDMTLFQEMTAVWNDWIGTYDPPSRSCVSGGSLQPEALIEVVATASIPGPEQENTSIERFGIVEGEGRPTMCLGLACKDWFTVCTLASDCSEDITGQTKQILRDFDTFLAEARTGKSKILTMDIWLKRVSDSATVNDVLMSWLVPDQLPSSSCVRADMARPEMLIEIRITASR
jgi:enamine deaminase RidA (YjgF/YER057c/UK114 family)